MDLGIQSWWYHDVHTDALVKKEESPWVGAFILFYVLLVSIQWKQNTTFHSSLWFSSGIDITNFYQGQSLRELCYSCFLFLLLGGPAEIQFFSLDA